MIEVNIINLDGVMLVNWIHSTDEEIQKQVIKNEMFVVNNDAPTCVPIHQLRRFTSRCEAVLIAKNEWGGDNCTSKKIMLDYADDIVKYGTPLFESIESIESEINKLHPKRQIIYHYMSSKKKFVEAINNK